MKKYIVGLSIALIFAMTGGCGHGGSDAGPSEPVVLPPEVRIVAGVSQVYPGDFSLTIDVTDVVSAAGIYFRLNYDTKIIQIKNINNPVNSVTEGSFFNQGGVTTNMAVNFLDHNPGSGCLLAGLSRAGGNTGINGAGTVMTFTFTTVSAGSTSIKFSESAADNSLFTPDNPVGSISSVRWTNAEVIVR